MFYHEHPHAIFIPKGTKKLIIGTLPPPRFSTGDLKKEDVNFCYGSCDGNLWKALERIFSLKLSYNNSLEAVKERKVFLEKNHIGICDIVHSCKREKIDSSDLGMQEVVLRDILAQLSKHPSIQTLIFTGGNTKNGPEYFFRKQLKSINEKLKVESSNTPKEHSFIYEGRLIKTISLTSPSNAANRAIGANAYYKKQKAKNPAYTTFDFRLEQYKKVFLGE